MWGFKQSNIDFIGAVGRYVKFIVPTNISQISVYKQIVDLFINIHFIYTLKIISLTIKYFPLQNILFHFTSRHTINFTSKSNKQTYKPSMVCGRRVSGAAKHRLHPSIYFKLENKIQSEKFSPLGFTLLCLDSELFGFVRNSNASFSRCSYIKIIFLSLHSNK